MLIKFKVMRESNSDVSNVDWFSKFFHCQIPKATIYVILKGLPPRLNCVATLPCEIQKSENTAERLLIPS